MTLSYRPQTSEIPTQPGVYRFFDLTDRVLYVGKAKNLRNRLTSYFSPLDTLHERTRRMVTSASRVEWVIVGTEYEALQLEFTWIKEFNPPFNIQFRDDKSYPYLAITVGDEVPRVFVTRNKTFKNARYFGPYTKTWAIRETLDLLLPVFQIRSCTDGIYLKASRDRRPCLLGDIGRCSAPCVGRVTPAEHKAAVTDFVSFMNGNNSEYISNLRSRMATASANQDYENAAILRDNIVALETVASKSAVVLQENIEVDVFAIARDQLSAAVHMFIVREGRIRGVHSWNVDTELDVSDEDILDSALRTAYEEDTVPPKEVIVQEIPSDSQSLELWLTEIRRDRLRDTRAAYVKLKVAKRGDLASLSQTVKVNAQQALLQYTTKRAADYVTRTQAISDLQKALGLETPPLRIECFDISHLSGTHIVGSMVVFEDGLPKKSDYRKFSIANAPDDTAAISEVITRRGSYLTGAKVDEVNKPGSFSYPPGLLLVDGGIPQVNAAARALKALKIDIPVVGIAKRLEELWLPGDDFPVILPRNSEALFLVQKLRDEAHRFALSFQKNKRKKDIKTVLSEIPGLGPKKVSALLKVYKSVAAIKKVSENDLEKVPGISPQLAHSIKQYLFDL